MISPVAIPETRPVVEVMDAMGTNKLPVVSCQLPVGRSGLSGNWQLTTGNSVPSIVQNAPAVQFRPGVFAGGKIVGGEVGTVGAFAFARGRLAAEAIQCPQRQKLPAGALGTAERLSGISQVSHMNLHVHVQRSTDVLSGGAGPNRETFSGKVGGNELSVVSCQLPER